MIELLSCPFCGSQTDLEVANTGVHWAVCVCGVEGPTAGTEADAIAQWNTRATPPSVTTSEQVKEAVEVPTQEFFLRAMAENYAGGHNWDHLDKKTCLMAADEIAKLRAALSPSYIGTTGNPGEQALRDALLAFERIRDFPYGEVPERHAIVQIAKQGIAALSIPAGEDASQRGAGVNEHVLWCCHARGPDDVYAAPDYETALAWSDALNETNWRSHNGLTIADPKSFQDCMIKAVPAPWPHSPEAHAEDLPRSIAGFASPSEDVEVTTGANHG